jgi:hypothetical protein
VVLQLTGTIPVIFVIVADPVGSGFVKSLPRPGGMLDGIGDEVARATSIVRFDSHRSEPRLCSAARCSSEADCPNESY